MKNTNNLTNISENSLFELAQFTGSVNSLLNRDFLHIKKFVPLEFQSILDRLIENIEQEIENREL